MDSLSACLFKEANFHCFLSYPFTMALPSTLGQIYERVHISEKTSRAEPLISKAVHVSLLLHEQDCPLQFDSKPLLFQKS